ncbi:hypothetical protein JCM11251_004410 [Rhodosporidiobolus azoricus]
MSGSWTKSRTEKRSKWGEAEDEVDDAWPDLRLALHSPAPTIQDDSYFPDSDLPLPPTFIDSSRLYPRSPYAWANGSSASSVESYTPSSHPQSIANEPLPPQPYPLPLDYTRSASTPSDPLTTSKKPSHHLSPPHLRFLLSSPHSRMEEVAFSPYDLGTAFATFLEDVTYGGMSSKQALSKPPSRHRQEVESLASERTSPMSFLAPPSASWEGSSDVTEEGSEPSILCATAASLEGRWMAGEVY